MKLIDRTELAEILGCSVSSIKHWERLGLPIAVYGRGRGCKVLYDAKRAVEWCYRNGYPDPVTQLHARFRARG